MLHAFCVINDYLFMLHAMFVNESHSTSNATFKKGVHFEVV